GDSRRASLGLLGKRVILSVGRLVPLKNLTVLVDAMREVRRQQPLAHLVLVGEGPERERLKQRVADLDLTGAVTFAGYVPQTETAAYYRAADVFALSSDFDNSPNVVLEAMASGLPVVSTDVGGVADFVDRDNGGALVPRGDAPALARSLL